MSETNKRIISAFVLAAIFISVVVFFKQLGLTILIGSLGLFVIDELLVNFIKGKRFSLIYLLSQVLYILQFIFFNFIRENIVFLNIIANLGAILSIGLAGYLFSVKSQIAKSVLTAQPLIVSLFCGIMFNCLAWTSHQDGWMLLTVLLLVANFTVDTGAWFFGKNFGKKKLWPSVSPNKTIVGSVGGILSSALISSIVVYMYLNKFSIMIIIGFLIIGVFSQLGDLVQSKLKRQFDIKDSSKLIPGHGGVYDRLDSLVFTVPFYIIFVNNLLQ